MAESASSTCASAARSTGGAPRNAPSRRRARSCSGSARASRSSTGARAKATSPMASVSTPPRPKASTAPYDGSRLRPARNSRSPPAMRSTSTPSSVSPARSLRPRKVAAASSAPVTPSTTRPASVLCRISGPDGLHGELAAEAGRSGRRLGFARHQLALGHGHAVGREELLGLPLGEGRTAGRECCSHQLAAGLPGPGLGGGHSDHRLSCAGRVAGLRPREGRPVHPSPSAHRASLLFPAPLRASAGRRAARRRSRSSPRRGCRRPASPPPCTGPSRPSAGWTSSAPRASPRRGS